MVQPTDPAAFFRDMLGQWEKMTNSLGAEAMKSEGFARGMQGASAASLSVQTAFREATEKAFAAANLPTRTDLDALAARVTAIEAALVRIEDVLGTRKAVDKPKPTRTRKPPSAA